MRYGYEYMNYIQVGINTFITFTGRKLILFSYWEGTGVPAPNEKFPPGEPRELLKTENGM